MIYLHRYTTADEGDTSVEIARLRDEIKQLTQDRDRLLRACKFALLAFEQNAAINWDDLDRAIDGRDWPTIQEEE